MTAQQQQPQSQVIDNGYPPQGYRNTIIAAACLGLVWFGDAVIYVVLPVFALTFGFDALTVGVLLSVNRVVRIIGYGWVAPLARAYGSNVLTAAACAAGAISTLAYGLLSGFVLLFIARMIWGAAWGIINLTMTAYAYGDGRGAGMRIGVARAVSSVGALAALVASVRFASLSDLTRGSCSMACSA